MLSVVTHTALLPRRFLNKLRTIGRPLLAALLFLGKICFYILRFIWNILTVIFTGGEFGKWVDHEYGEYYHSEHWKHVRHQALELHHYHCAVCGEKYINRGRKLTVRHLHHERDGKSVHHREDPEKDLIVLCEDHNQKGHHVHGVQSWKSAYRWYGAFSQ
jgi:hypothetical protein